MSHPVKIAPSILSADFAAFGAECRLLEEAGADWIHVDVMDGHFVPNITFGPQLVRAIRPHVAGTIDVHLMIAPVDPYIAAFAEAGADIVQAHVEAGPHLHRTLGAIREAGCRAGVALNPATPVAAVAHVLDLVDVVNVMTVNPGFGGQAFIEPMVEKVRSLRAMIGDRGTHVQVDGGVSAENAARLVRAGADVLVAGSSVFRGVGEGEGDARRAVVSANIKALREAGAAL